MNIAIFSDAFYPQINGIVTSILSLASKMAERGHKVIIVSPSYRNLEEIRIPGVKIIRVPSVSASFYDDFKWTNPFSFSTYKALRKENIDIVHFMTPVFISMIGIKFARKMGIPVVGTFHTFIANPKYFEHLFNGPVKASEEISWKYLNLYYNCADFVSAPTEEAVRIIAEHDCTAPLEAVSNGIDFNQFDNSRAPEFREKYGLGKKAVLFVGRVAHEKSITELIDAFDIVFSSEPEAQLLIVGDGPQRKEFEDYAASKACAENVVFTGAIGHDDLVTSGAFASVALFATASVTETQGITVLEAQANSLPCVGAAEGGILNLIEDGVNGYLTPPGDCAAMAEGILKVLNDNSGEMGRKALELVEIHRLERIIDRWEDIYTGLVENRGTLGSKDYLHFRDLLKFAKTLKVDFQYLLDKIRKPWSMLTPLPRREKKKRPSAVSFRRLHLKARFYRMPKFRGHSLFFRRRLHR